MGFGGFWEDGLRFVGGKGGKGGILYVVNAMIDFLL